MSLAEEARVGRVAREWQGFYKDNDGEAHIVDMRSIEYADAVPPWPVVHPGPLHKLPQVKPPTPVSVSWQTAVILPDIQLGYYRNADGELEAIHDEAALSIALAITKAEQPDVVVLVGDNLDLAEFSRYRLSSAYQMTTQATVDRGALLSAQLRAAAPSARIVWIEGNHEARLPNHILDNAKAAFGLKVGGMPDSWPVLSVPVLCRFDDYGIEYLPGYPASKFWINERLRVIHGHKVKSGGSTAHAYLATERVSTIFGHVHRREYGSRTREGFEGNREIMAASPGCLCRVDGAVPSTKGGIDLDGRPLPTGEDWAQGLAVVKYEPGDGRFTYHNIAIHDGWALWGGREYAG